MSRSQSECCREACGGGRDHQILCPGSTAALALDCPHDQHFPCLAIAAALLLAAALQRELLSTDIHCLPNCFREAMAEELLEDVDLSPVL